MRLFSIIGSAGLRLLGGLALCVSLVACGGGSDGSGTLGTNLKASFVDPQTGVWWNPAEAGRGFALELQGNSLALGAYMYEDSGVPVWYVGTLGRQADGTFQGVISRYAGGQTLGGSYRAPSSSAPAATATFAATSATQASLTLATTGATQVVPVQRLAFSGATAAPSGASFENGLWWNDTQSGRGFFVDVQGTRAALASYMYDDSGRPVWYLTVSDLVGQKFTGLAERYQGGQALNTTFRAAVSAGNAGTLSFQGTSATTAVLTLPDGSTVALKRLVFDTSPSTGTPLVKVEGLYEGSASTGESLVMLGLDNGELWTVYGSAAGGVLAPQGLLLATGGASNGVYTSSSAMGFEDGSVVTGDVWTGTYVARTSVTGSISEGAGTKGTSFTASAVAPASYNYDQAPSVASVVGAWSGKVTGGGATTFTISAQGAVTATVDGCAISGTVTPRAGGKNVLSLNVTITGPDCGKPDANGVISASGGLVTYLLPNGQTRMVAAMTNGARTEGFAFVGQR